MKQQILLEKLSDHPALTITYFVPDAKKSGGAYVTISGNLKRLTALNDGCCSLTGQKFCWMMSPTSKASCSAICFECRLPCDQTEDDFSYTVTVSKAVTVFLYEEESS